MNINQQLELIEECIKEGFDMDMTILYFKEQFNMDMSRDIIEDVYLGLL